MERAEEIARQYSLDPIMPTGCVITTNGNVVAQGANGSQYHLEYGCNRVRMGVGTGERYDICLGCHPNNHAEARAIANTETPVRGGNLYLWGHYGCCESCWQLIIDNGIKNVFLLIDSQVLFNKKHPDNIVGRQFFKSPTPETD